MADTGLLQQSPLFWSTSQLVGAYRSKKLSPVDVAHEAIARIEEFDSELGAFLTRFDEKALEQAKLAELAYQTGAERPLSGIPVAVKDTFDLVDELTTYGSQFYSGHISERDCGTVQRLRAAGSVFVGKANTAEFGQSATTENTIIGASRNPWDTTRTPGGSSGGPAASVAAGLATVALAADGGGSIRIPGAFTGLYGLKPTHGLVDNEYGLPAMSDFVCPGSLSRYVSDARTFLEVLTGRSYAKKPVQRGLKVAWCANPEGRPVDPAVADIVARTVKLMGQQGHDIIETELPLSGWKDVFGPLVLGEEARERSELLARTDLELTDYERVTLEAARDVSQDDIDQAREDHFLFKARLDDFMSDFDAFVTPATATCAFPLHQRPTEIDGRKVSELWGAVPFTSPFNVSGQPAADIPCGLVDGLPAAIQIVVKRNNEQLLLDLSEELEAMIGFDHSPMWQRWAQKRQILQQEQKAAL